MSFFDSPVVFGCNTFTVLDCEVPKYFLSNPNKYRKVCFTPVGPVFQVMDCNSRTLFLRQYFADGSFSDSSHRITGTTNVYVLIDTLIFYNK